MGQLEKYNIYIMRTPEGKEKENGLEEIFKVIRADIFPKLMRDTKTQNQEVLRIASRIKDKNSTCKHILFQLQKTNTKRKS